MLVGVATLPTAPLLVDGVGRGLPRSLVRVRAAMRHVQKGLPDADVVLLVAAGTQALYDTAVVSLQGLGFPEVRHDLEVCTPAITALARSTQIPRIRAARLPLDLAVLALCLERPEPVVPIGVPAASFDTLTAIGTGTVQALEDIDLRTIVIAAGDLSAGLSPRSPLAAVVGAAEWDERVIAAVQSGRLDSLATLGPDRARAVGARGWPALAVLHGVCQRGKLGLTLRCYAAPRGVGYLVAAGG